nr:MAG TPA: hypothetical protein [Caudoviricetes sp.]
MCCVIFMVLTPFSISRQAIRKDFEFRPCEELREVLIFTDIIDLFHKEE